MFVPLISTKSQSWAQTKPVAQGTPQNMKNSPAPIRRSLLVIAALVTAIFTLTPVTSHADTVRSHTYTMNGMSTFSFSIYAFHDDDFTPSASSLWVNLTIIVRDPQGAVYAYVNLWDVQLSGSDLSLWAPDVVGSGIYCDYDQPYYDSSGEIEFNAAVQFFAPGSWAGSNYTVEVLLTKDYDSDDPQDVTYDD